MRFTEFNNSIRCLKQINQLCGKKKMLTSRKELRSSSFQIFHTIAILKVRYISINTELNKFCFSKASNFNKQDHMGHGIQEQTERQLWKTAFKKFVSDMICLRRPYHLSFFTWSILEYFAPSIGPYQISMMEFFKKLVNRCLIGFKIRL